MTPALTELVVADPAESWIAGGFAGFGALDHFAEPVEGGDIPMHRMP